MKIQMRRLFCVIFAALAAATATAGEERVVCSVDVPAWERTQSVTVRMPPLESGALENLFDRNPATLAILKSDGAIMLEFFFKEAIDIHQAGLTPCRGASYRWEAWFAPEPDQEGRFKFRPLVPKRTVRGGTPDPVRLDSAVRLRGLRLVIDRMTAGRQILLSEVEIVAAIAITGLDVHWPAAPLIKGGAYPLEVEGLDRHGGRTLLREGIKWALFPKKNILTIADSTARAIAPGKVEVRVAYGSIKHEPVKLTVRDPDPAPGALEVIPLATTVAVRADFDVPADHTLMIFRREDGKQPEETPRHRTPVNRFNDFGLAPGSIWHYSAAIANREGIAVTQSTAEQRVQIGVPDGAVLCAAANLEVLVPVYGEDLPDEDVIRLLRGFEMARTFFFRNSAGRLNVDLCPVRIDAEIAPERGPLFYAVEFDLAERGLLDQASALIHVAGPCMDLNCGGACFSNGAAASFGTSASAPAPFIEPPAVSDACWTFVHEFQHSIQGVLDAARTTPSMLHGHFIDNFPLAAGAAFDAGDFYDGQAAILRRYEGYDDFPAPWDGRIEGVDSDDDGLPDDDPRWPVDEKRFGSDPAAADSDGDGLDDLGEYCAGIYSAADPADPDTDGDGLSDGCDPYPLSTFTGEIGAGTPPENALPGAILSRDLSFRSGPDAPDDFRVLASWDAGNLYLGFDAAGPVEITIHLDGSGHLGAFASDTAGGDVYTAERALRISYGDGVLYKGNEPVDAASVESWQSGERWRIRAAIPASLGPGTVQCRVAKDARSSGGLTLVAGRVIGLNFIVRSESAGGWAAVYELHRFYDARLVRKEE